MAVSGSITLNGVTDTQMVRVWEYKAKANAAFGFQPNVLQPVPGGQGSTYNNLLFNWQTEEGLKVVHEIIDYLLKKEEQATAVAR